MFFAQDRDAFQHLFVAGLDAMLDAQELGAFILVLANSMQDRAIHDRLAARLQQKFASHCTGLDTTGAAADDIAVFTSLCASGIDDFVEWQLEHNGPWLQLLNPLRALRPVRAAAGTVDSIERAFDDVGFHFNKPFLKPEILYRGRIENSAHACDVSVLYNKFPFMPYHYMLVPEADAGHAQYLTPQMHAFAWQMMQQASAAIAGTGFGYNSIGAGASVNHLHFQGFVYDDVLPVEAANWQHNGGDEAYPLTCMKFTDAATCWQAIASLHAADQAYNLLYREGCCYVFVRRMQGVQGARPRVQGAGWIEAVGVFVEADADALQNIPAESLHADIRSLAV
jgi:hypothetical protein